MKDRLHERLQEDETTKDFDDFQDCPDIDDIDGNAPEAPCAPKHPPEFPPSNQPLSSFALSTGPGPLRNKTAKNARKDAKNRAKRSQNRAALPEKDLTPSAAALQRCRESEALKTDDFSLENDAQISSGGYSGKKQEFERVHTSVAELEAQGLKEVQWNAEYATFFLFHRQFSFRFVSSKSYTLLDSDSYVIGVLGGYPRGTDWSKVNKEASNGCRNARSLLSFTDKQTHHRRMDAPAVAIGVSFGGGAKVSSSSSMLNRL